MLIKSPLNINFSQGLDLKTDDKQVTLGKFLSLENSIFTKGGLLQKRNGFQTLSALPNSTFTYVTTLTNGLVAIGNSLSSYSSSAQKWINKGFLQPIALSTLPLVRSSTNQTYADSQTAPNGLICTAYIDAQASGNVYAYTIADSISGQIVVPETPLVTNLVGRGVANRAPRVFVLGNYFIIGFGTSNNFLEYIAIPYNNPTLPFPAADITSSYVYSAPQSWDGIVYGNNLYIAYRNSSGLVTTVLSSLLVIGLSITYAGYTPTMLSLAVPTTGAANRIYVSWVNSDTTSGFTLAMNEFLVQIMAPTAWISGTQVINNITSTTETGDSVNIYGEANYDLPWGPQDCSIGVINLPFGGSPSGAVTIANSVSLASKAFTINNIDYMLATYVSSLQNTYFLISGTGQIISRFAYQNGGGELSLGLPNISINGSTVSIPYRTADLISTANSGTALVSTPTAPVSLSAVYAQTGINLVNLNFAPPTISSSEIAETLNVSGGMLWSYDGVKPVEQGFNLFPDNLDPLSTASTGGGSITPGTYYYQVTYEWTDNNGNINRSAPSIPISIVVTSTNTITLNVPTLRLTYKSNVSIVVYRWSAAQQVYYALKPYSSAPTYNDTTVPYVTIVDTNSDAQILGNPILYTTGGVIEDIAGPATSLITLFNNRLFLVDAEDPNLLWYSKQVIEAVPVEMSDLLTIYVAPTTGAQGSTGPITAIAPMDDKLIVFKENAIYYINGVGPDNTGSNGTYSDAIYVSSSVGCANQNSLILMPNGIMFQSDKGIWLLGRDLSTTYIGAPVESLTLDTLVNTALLIPGTNQVRFTMDSGITLMYDYYYGQWGTFVNIPGISSTLYNGLHTFINASGSVFQETLGSYLDNGSPVLMQFTTGWANLAGLQGYERTYFFFLLGQYITPFKLQVSLAYNYNAQATQVITVLPEDASPAFGDDALWGSGTPFGGQNQVFKARVFPQVQKCESFQISIQEVYDSALGIVSGAGLTLSGMNLVIGAKKGYRTQSAGRSFG
jgi:hypothetical protein